eukprot:7248149-Prymnesium_polylepis.1
MLLPFSTRVACDVVTGAAVRARAFCVPFSASDRVWGTIFLYVAGSDRLLGTTGVYSFAGRRGRRLRSPFYNGSQSGLAEEVGPDRA